VDFSRPEVPPIEAAFEKYFPGRWRRADKAELGKHSKSLRAPLGWRLRVASDEFACPGIDHLFVFLDKDFPRTDPRVCAPQADRGFAWPHVEAGGLLCLKQTARDADPGERVLAQLAWTAELLRLDEAERDCEFAREFSAYWGQRLSPKAPTFLSLVRSDGGSREVWYYDDWAKRRVVIADDRRSLSDWLRQSGRAPASADIKPTYLIWLNQPWRPNEFPDTGRNILAAIPRETQAEILVPAQKLPVLIGANTETGPVFVGVVLTSATEKILRKGFRSGATIPLERIAGSFSAFPVRRCSVERVDGVWVHGRDHNAEYARLSRKQVAIVGCGSLGGFVARLLTQAGVGRFILVDPEMLASHNAARHVLGLDGLGERKAEALAAMLIKQFPHIPKPSVYVSRFEDLHAPALEALASADLIISAGIDYEGDMRLDAWRRQCVSPPVHICVWAEEFALAGHAIVLVGDSSLSDAFSATGAPAVALTDTWPETAHVVEAGCANVFQPHGAVDLQNTVVLGARLALDVLNARVTQSSRRTWQGDRDAVIRLGGTPRAAFTESFVERTHTWPP
jgi:hypothetical protein